MKPNTKGTLRSMSEKQLVNRFNYLKSRRSSFGDSNMMKYIKYQLRKRFGREVGK